MLTQRQYYGMKNNAQLTEFEQIHIDPTPNNNTRTLETVSFKVTFKKIIISWRIMSIILTMGIVFFFFHLNIKWAVQLFCIVTQIARTWSSSIAVSDAFIYVFMLLICSVCVCVCLQT